jgi:hypothetical protein
MAINENQPFNLYNFGKTIGDPARPYLFLITIPEIGTDTVVTSLARSANIPAQNMSEIPISFQGMNLYIGGTPTYDEWQVTFLCDEAHELRRLFLKWNSLIYDAGTSFVGHSNTYKSDKMGVAQLARNGKQVSRIGFVGAFPKSVGQIELAHGTTGEAETFQVTFRYDFFVNVNQFGEQTTAGSSVRPTTATRISRGSPPPAGNWTQFKPQ